MMLNLGMQEPRTQIRNLEHHHGKRLKMHLNEHAHIHTRIHMYTSACLSHTPTRRPTPIGQEQTTVPFFGILSMPWRSTKCSCSYANPN